MTPQTTEYRVRLDAFEGPLDLLLFLIRRAEVEITDIPIATITDQFMHYLDEGGVEAIDIEKAGEFLVMAATLMEIKSRMLMPRRAPDAGDGTGDPGGDAAAATFDDSIVDPRADLVKQLLAYKRFRDAAGSLQHRLEEWESRFPAAGAGMDAASLQAVHAELADVDIDDIELIDLVSAFARIIETVDLSRVGEHHVVVDDTPIELHAQDILELLRKNAASTESRDAPAAREVEFSSIFVSKTRSEMIGMFLAMLELVRQRLVGVRQDDSDGKIYLGLAEPSPASSTEGPQPADSAGTRQEP